MRNLTRIAAVSVAVCLSLSAVALTGPAAQAVPGVTLIGTAPASANGPSTISFSYAISLPTDVTGAAFATHQAAAVPASNTAVTLDGRAIPANQVSQPSSVDIAAQLGDLTAGTHMLAFLVPIAATGSASTSSTASLSYTDGAGPATVTSNTVSVQVNQPDLAVSLTPGAGEDQVGFLGTGQDLDLLVDVANLGYGTPNSTLTIALPPGMTLGASGVLRDSDGSNVSCSNGIGTTVVCNLGRLVRGASDPTLDIDLTTLPNEPVGSTVPVTVSVAPNAGEGTDSDPSNDSASVQVLYTGIAHLSYQISPAANKVAIGQSTKLTLTVHNAGPQKAPQAIAIAIIIGGQFEVTDFTGDSAPAGSASRVATQLAKQAQLLTAPAPGVNGVSAAPAAGGGTGILWYIGDLAPGASVAGVLTLKAKAVGKVSIELLAVSAAGDPGCTQFDCTPTTVALTVVPAAPTTPAAPAGAGAEPAGGGLANTGASDRTAAIGGSLLLVGAALMFAARRRTVRGR